MGLFRKSKAVENEPIDAKSPQEISGGNLFNNYMERQVRKQIALDNLNAYTQKQTIKNKLQEKKLIKYYLLQLQADYFINTINYEMEDWKMYDRIKTLLRHTFINGVGCIYKHNGKYIIGVVSKVEVDIYDEPKEVVFYPLNNSNIEYKSLEELQMLNQMTITDVENISILKWGSGISAWINMWKFINIQSSLLTMINVDSLSYIKKLMYIINNPNTSLEELEAYYDEESPYIVAVKGADLNNRLEFNELVGKGKTPNDIVEHYKQVCGIYYAMFGRRVNNDFKKERSITAETDLTEDNYAILEKNWIDSFKVFADDVKKLGINIRVIEKEEKENETNSNETDRDNQSKSPAMSE